MTDKELREKLINYFASHTWCDGMWMAEKLADEVMPYLNQQVQAKQVEILEEVHDKLWEKWDGWSESKLVMSDVRSVLTTLKSQLTKKESE